MATYVGIKHVSMNCSVFSRGHECKELTIYLQVYLFLDKSNTRESSSFLFLNDQIPCVHSTVCEQYLCAWTAKLRVVDAYTVYRVGKLVLELE